MILKEKKGRSEGKYECTRCGLERVMKINRIEIKEKSFEERHPRPSEELKIPLLD